MVNRNSPKKSPEKKKIVNKKVMREHTEQKERNIERATIDREDDILHELNVNSEQYLAVGKLEEEAEVNLVYQKYRGNQKQNVGILLFASYLQHTFA